ncbi:MAG: ABC transporter substrate-binding protein [Thaumarchaeota archaeon]|nr:ABC transporter substrate-binding protein [Nitrososphaerota archaeon]
MKKRGASTSVVIGSLIVGLLIGAAIIYVAAPSLGLSGGGGRTTVNNSLCNGQTIHIGALNDLSGQLSSQGQADLVSEQVGIVDVNNYLKAGGCNLTFVLDNNDYKLDTPTALSQLTAMHTSGVQVVLGPLNSGTARGILSYANSNHIVLISPSSTAPDLHVTDVTNNYLFRTAPNDGAQGQAVARELVTYGATAVVIVNRDDTYGNGLANATKAFLIKDGVSAANIQGPIKYDPTINDYSSLLSQINSAYNTLNTGANAGHTYIFAVTFEELGSILRQAKTSNSPLYNVVPWFGSDGQAQNTKLTNTTTGPDVSHVVLPSTLFNVVNNSKTIAFVNGLTASQRAAVASNFFYALEGYNDVWLAALSILSAGANDGTAIHSVFPTVANNYYGLTGWEGLSGNDRQPGSYQIWKAVASGGAYTWVLAGSWDFDTDTVTWLNKP